jgi:hypothetical protein
VDKIISAQEASFVKNDVTLGIGGFTGFDIRNVCAMKGEPELVNEVGKERLRRCR